jgi:hypothetical protein
MPLKLSGGWVAVVGWRWLGGGGWVAVVGWRWLGGGAWPVMGVARCGCGAEAEFVVSDPMLMDKSGPVGSHDLVLDEGTLHDCSARNCLSCNRVSAAPVPSGKRSAKHAGHDGRQREQHERLARYRYRL